ncbi:hypothetical protein P3S67_013193 [Capsicum chacoense]
MEIGLAVGGAFLSSFLQVLFDRLAPQGELLKMFQKNKHDVRLLKKLKMTLMLGTLLVNYEALPLKVEGQLRNFAETSNQQVSNLKLSLSDDFFLNIKEKLEDTIETSEDLQNQIGLLGLKEHFVSTKRENKTSSTSVVEFDVFGRRNEKKELIDCLTSKDASEKNLTVVPIVGIGAWARQHFLKLLTMMRRMMYPQIILFLPSSWDCLRMLENLAKLCYMAGLNLKNSTSWDYADLVKDCAALLAYELPQKSSVGYLLGDSQREIIADAVNAMVLSTNPSVKDSRECLHSRLDGLLRQLSACFLEKRLLNGDQGEGFHPQRILYSGRKG